MLWPMRRATQGTAVQSRYIRALYWLAWLGLGALAYAAAPPAPQIFVDTPVRPDPDRPLKIGQEFYPAESVKLREEGTCVVRVTVDKSGDIHDPQVITSSGFARLDAACVVATSSGHFLPATRGGIPIDSMANVPILWKLPKPATLADCMAIPPSLPLEKVRADHPDLPKVAKPGVPSRVILRLFVSEKGTVDGAKVDESSGYARLDEASLKGVQGQKMQPAMAGGQGIASCVTMPIVWKLD
jgi:TonB family protein